MSATLQSLCISDAFCILHRACICTHFSAFLDLHSRAFQAHRCASGLQKSHSLHILLLRSCVAAGGSADPNDDDEAEELPEAVVVVLNKMSLKPEQFDIEVTSSDDAQAKKTKKEALIKKMVAKINPSRSGGPTQSQLEASSRRASSSVRPTRTTPSTWLRSLPLTTRSSTLRSWPPSLSTATLRSLTTTSELHPRLFAHLLRIFTHSCASGVHFPELYRGKLCLECAFLRIRRAFVFITAHF